MKPGVVPYLMGSSNAAYVPLYVPRSTSLVRGNLARIETGPCSVSYKGSLCGHTLEGVKFEVPPDLRERKVDEYGTIIVELIAQGDRATMKATFVEKTLRVIRTVYMYGSEVSDTVQGVGRRPSVRAADLAGELVLHPIDELSSDNDVMFWKAAVSAAGEVNFGTATADRVFECTFTMLVDESRSDGQMLGQIGVA